MYTLKMFYITNKIASRADCWPIPVLIHNIIKNSNKVVGYSSKFGSF